mgnify:CR=1 FL=1
MTLEQLKEKLTWMRDAHYVLEGGGANAILVSEDVASILLSTLRDLSRSKHQTIHVQHDMDGQRHDFFVTLAVSKSAPPETIMFITPAAYRNLAPRVRDAVDWIENGGKRTYV